MKINALVCSLLFVASQAPLLLPAVAAEGSSAATVTGGGAANAGQQEGAGGRRELSPEQRQAARERCQADPAKCRAESRARREQWCKDNAEKCSEAKARAQQRREQCKADPEKCRAEAKAREEARFKRADTDGNGALSRAEAEKGMRALARHFDQIDANKDGQITREEIEAARKAREGARRGKANAG